MAKKEIQPIVLTSSDEEVETITLFTLDGVEYKIPTKVGHNITLQAMEVYVKSGSQDAAALWSLEYLLGAKGWQALKDFDELTEENFEQIMEVAENIVIGPGKKKRRIETAGGAK